MPDDLAEEMVRALSELRTQNSALAQRRTELQKVVDQFDGDIKRFKELRTSAAARISETQRIARSSQLAGRAQRVPVWPKPPAPRDDAAKSSTTSSRTCTTGTMTICAMRSPGCTTNSSALRFQQDTMSWPW